MKNFFIINVKRCGTALVFVFIFTVIWTEIGVCAPSIRIVDNGKPKAIIAISEKASAQVESSAGILREYIEMASKAKLPLNTTSGWFLKKSRIKIWIGHSKYVDKLKLNLNELEDDGFIIAFPNQKNILIVGKTDWGTEFGVYEFLERYVGVRWLLPGTNGEHVPEHSSLDIPIQEIRQNPAFFSRHMSGFKGEAQTTWARRNRIFPAVSFHHNLLNLFPPEKYTKTHPNFFPIQNGKRYLPPTNQTQSWQPCFSADGIVEEAVKNICDYFSQYPWRTSYSLGINDGAGFCECERCKSKYSGKKNFLGLQDLSDRYFEWANAVVEGVLKKYPDKWFGCLAYSHIAQPPSQTKINPRIIPFMTYDRMKWIDKEIETEGRQITEWWASESSSFGWYDYIYGTPYLVPRVYFHKMAEYYLYGYKHGVRAMYAEAYPNWGEGPKLYIALKLQWDPGLDVDELLKDWYISAVGKDAAPYLAAYYEHWENFWTVRVLKSKWFTKSGQFLAFSHPGYLDLVSYEDILKSRRLLETVLEKTKTTQQRKRAEMLLKAFEYYEASAISYLGLVRHKQQPDKDRKYYEDMGHKRLKLVNEFENDPILVHPIRFDNNKWKINETWR